MYKLWKDKKPNIDYFRVFECKCFILSTKDNLGKFDPKSHISIFLGYSNSSRVYRVYNKRTLVIKESMHVIFDEFNSPSIKKVLANDDVNVDNIKNCNMKNSQKNNKYDLLCENQEEQ